MTAWFKMGYQYHSQCGKDSFTSVRRSKSPALERHPSACDCVAVKSHYPRPSLSRMKLNIFQHVTNTLRSLLNRSSLAVFRGCLPESISANILRTQLDLLIMQPSQEEKAFCAARKFRREPVLWAISDIPRQASGQSFLKVLNWVHYSSLISQIFLQLSSLTCSFQLTD